MGHAHGDIFDAARRRAFDQLVEQRNDRLAAFERKPFLAEILRVQKAFELFGRDQFPSNCFLTSAGIGSGLNKLLADLLAHPDFSSLL